MIDHFGAGVVIAAIGWASVSSAQAKTPERILFIGNSYTYVNNLPALITNMVNSAGGKVPLVKSHTPGGCTLIKHSKDPKALALIDEGDWDVVVLQGNSQEAALAETSEATRNAFLTGGMNLAKRIREKSPQAHMSFIVRSTRESPCPPFDSKVRLPTRMSLS